MKDTAKRIDALIRKAIAACGEEAPDREVVQWLLTHYPQEMDRLRAAALFEDQDKESSDFRAVEHAQ